MKILLVEDEMVLAKNIESFLVSEGYVCELASNFDEAFEKVSIYEYDCVLLDITLPGGSGLQILQELKSERPNTGVIIISAKNSLDDKLEGLDTDADDYLTKPFHLSELNSRIKALIRRRHFEGRNEVVFEEISILPDQQAVFVKKNEIRLTKIEFDLLMFFVANRHRVLSRESIAEHLWDDEADLSDNFDFLYSHIKNLRKKLKMQEGRTTFKQFMESGINSASHEADYQNPTCLFGSYATAFSGRRNCFLLLSQGFG